MHITRIDSNTLEIGGITPGFAELLLQIPVRARIADPQVQARLYSTPTHGAEPECDQDWREHVEPDLREYFRSASDMVQEDLSRLVPSPEGGMTSLRLSLQRLNAWIHTLNQARLALAARHDLTEAVMERQSKPRDEDAAMALIIVDMYAEILGIFIAIQSDSGL